MVLRNGLTRGRLAGVMTALGIGSALVVHVVYSVLGLALIIASSPAVFSLIRVCGALYLLYIAGRALMSARTAMPMSAPRPGAPRVRPWLAGGKGFGAICSTPRPPSFS